MWPRSEVSSCFSMLCNTRLLSTGPHLLRHFVQIVLFKSAFKKWTSECTKLFSFYLFKKKGCCVTVAESYQLYVPELAPVGKAVGRIIANDEDEGRNADMSYSITNADAAAIFTITTDTERREGIISLKQVWIRHKDTLMLLCELQFQVWLWGTLHSSRMKLSPLAGAFTAVMAAQFDKLLEVSKTQTCFTLHSDARMKPCVLTFVTETRHRSHCALLYFSMGCGLSLLQCNRQEQNWLSIGSQFPSCV